MQFACKDIQYNLLTAITNTKTDTCIGAKQQKKKAAATFLHT